MNDQTFYELQILKLKNLLQGAEDDPIMAPQLQARIRSAEKKLEEARRQPSSLLPKDSFELVRAAIFLRGEGVHDSEGIRPSLAGEALIRYEQMFVAQALHDEREAARKAGRQRRPKGSPTPTLLFSGTPRGSFGLEFVPQPVEDRSLLAVHTQSLRNIAETVERVAERSDSLGEAISRIPPRVVAPLKLFVKALANHGAELRLAFSDRPSVSISHEKLRSAADHLEKEVTQADVTLTGTFRGVALESGVFDLKTDEGEVVSGTVPDSYSEEELEALHQLTNQRCVLDLISTTVSKISGPTTTLYVLQDARPAQAPKIHESTP